MKFLLRLGSTLALASLVTMSAAPAPLSSRVYDWQTLEVTPTPNGERRMVFDGPTATLDQLQCHITTLNPGQNSGEPRRHLQEEVLIVKEGLVEAHVDGRTQTAGPGSVLFFAANAVTQLRNAGNVRCNLRLHAAHAEAVNQPHRIDSPPATSFFFP